MAWDRNASKMSSSSGQQISCPGGVDADGGAGADGGVIADGGVGAAVGVDADGGAGHPCGVGQPR
mgnify:FL=1